jgi:PEP-CTERM motif
MNKLCVALIALSASTAANAATTISFGTPTGNLGNTHVYTTGGLTVTASGFTAANAATALYGKNGGGDEVGLGLANDPSGDHEIYYGMGYVQLDVSALFGLVSSVSFSTNSTTAGERWSIFGSNVAHSYGGVALLSGTNENTATLPSFGTYKYYDFVSTSQSGGQNFLITGLTMTAVPEPATWAMMLIGFGGIGFQMRRKRSKMVFQIA